MSTSVLLVKEDAIEQCSREWLTKQLNDTGYCLVSNMGGQHHAVSLMQSLGHFISQYNGAVEHDVTYKPGFDDQAYSQSINTIRAHTEAPGWRSSPRYLALYCKQQAQCGGGYTDLLDYQDVIASLNPDELKLVANSPISFPGPDNGIESPMLNSKAERPVFRFSFNLLTAGEYDPKLSETANEEKLPLGLPGVALAHKVNQLFEEQRSSILIPDDGLLIWDNQRMLHARSEYSDKKRHLVRYWIA